MAIERAELNAGANLEPTLIQERARLHQAQSSPQEFTLFERESADQGERFTDPRLNIVIGGVRFDNPVLVGAGYDKEAQVVSALHRVGFGGVEVGSVPVNPQDGNPQPRHFEVVPGVSINRYGFNSVGMETVAHNLAQYRDSGIPIGISVGKNKTVPDELAPEAHAGVVEGLYDDASYFVINVSSPNTPGLRALQDREPLTHIVRATQGAMDRHGERKPLFVKIAPDLTFEAIDDVIDVVRENDVTGIIASNTTIDTSIKGKYTRDDGSTWADEAGGLSGDDIDYRKRTTDIIRHIYEKTNGGIAIIGVGGIKDGGTALEKIKAGASLVQVVTAIHYEGLGLPGRVNREIVAEMERLGLEHLEQLVGYDVHPPVTEDSTSRGFTNPTP